MKLYDDLIRQTFEVLEPLQSRRWPYDESLVWPENDENRLILRREAACELGSGQHAISMLLVTDRPTLIKEDQVELIGPDLAEITGSANYARLTLACVSDMPADDDAWYRLIQDIDFAKYKMFPDGLMMRFSVQSRREQIYVGKDALARGLSLRRAGMNFIRQYKRNPAVTQVRQIFITDPAADYEALAALATKADRITSALNHILKGLPTDCSRCDLKPICDEVEGMREVHFQSAAIHAAAL